MRQRRDIWWQRLEEAIERLGSGHTCKTADCGWASPGISTMLGAVSNRAGQQSCQPQRPGNRAQSSGSHAQTALKSIRSYNLDERLDRSTTDLQSKL